MSAHIDKVHLNLIYTTLYAEYAIVYNEEWYVLSVQNYPIDDHQDGLSFNQVLTEHNNQTVVPAPVVRSYPLPEEDIDENEA